MLKMHKTKKKTVLSVLLAATMAFASVGCGSTDSTGADTSQAEPEETGTGCTYDFPQTGFGFELPDGIEISNGFVNPYDVGEANYGSGIMYGFPIYIDKTLETLTTMDDDEADQIHRAYSFQVACIKDAADDEDAREKLITDADGDLSDEELASLRQIHQEGDYTWYAFMVNKMTEDIDNNCAEEYDAFYDASEDIIANMKFCEPNVWQGSDAGEKISFQTTDLDGNAISSEELFASRKITMINIWATTCGPCINEMPELEKLSEEVEEKGGAIVGLVDDVPLGNNMYVEDAQDIVKTAGVTYLNLKAWDDYNDALAIVGTPTSYFVDSEGKLVGDPIVGANPKAYEERMNEYLSE